MSKTYAVVAGNEIYVFSADSLPEGSKEKIQEFCQIFDRLVPTNDIRKSYYRERPDSPIKYAVLEREDNIFSVMDHNYLISYSDRSHEIAIRRNRAFERTDEIRDDEITEILATTISDIKQYSFSPRRTPEPPSDLEKRAIQKLKDKLNPERPGYETESCSSYQGSRMDSRIPSDSEDHDHPSGNLSPSGNRRASAASSGRENRN